MSVDSNKSAVAFKLCSLRGLLLKGSLLRERWLNAYMLEASKTDKAIGAEGRRERALNPRISGMPFSWAFSRGSPIRGLS
jgi:hypothetical protein